jgi:5'-nucleotidase
LQVGRTLIAVLENYQQADGSVRLREVDPRRFAVKGTPTDCVIMGVRHLMPEPAGSGPVGVNQRPEHRRRRDVFRARSPLRWKARFWACRRLRMSQAYGFKTKDTLRWNCG